MPNALRMTVGTEEDNRAVVAALADFMRRRPMTRKSACSTRIALIGIGLIGSSIATPCAAKVSRAAIVGTRSTAQTRDTALQLGLVDQGLRDAPRGGAGRRSRHPLRAGRRLRPDRGGDRSALQAGRDPHRCRLGQGGGRARCRAACARRACTSFPATRSPAPSSRAPKRALPSCSTTAGAS